MNNTDYARASWESPSLPFREYVRKHRRQLLVRLWGPAGSIVFHLLAIGMLLATVNGIPPAETVSESVVLISTPLSELEKLPEPEKCEPAESLIPRTVTLWEPDADTVELCGGSGLRARGVGQCTGDANLSGRGLEMASTVQHHLNLKNRYMNRTADGRKGALERYGGSAATEAAVLRALRWLKQCQQADGSWHGGLSLTVYQGDQPAMTALALLAFLAHGETGESGEFGCTVKKAVDWLLVDLDASGHFRDGDDHDYSQPIGAYALCETYGITHQPVVKEAAVRAIAPVILGQNASGGFCYNLNPDGRNDSSYMGWCCQALAVARMAGLEKDVPGLTVAIKNAVSGFKMNADPGGGFGYVRPGRTGLSGAGALCLQLLGAPREPEVVATMKFLESCTFSFASPQQQPYTGNNSQLYYWYYITQAKFHYSSEAFAAWNRLFAPELCKQQFVTENVIEGPDGRMESTGCWYSPSKRSEWSAGVVQDTCLCCLMLEVYYRYLPGYQAIVAAEPPSEDVKVTIR